MNVTRLNFSHGAYSDHEQNYHRLRQSLQLSARRWASS